MPSSDMSTRQVEKIVLVVDNIESFLYGARGILEKKGYTVFTAATATNALDIIDSKRLHLLVIDNRLEDDLKIGDFSGFDLANNPALSRIPRIIYAQEAEEVVLKRWKEYIDDQPTDNVKIYSKGTHKIEDIVEEAFRWPRSRPDGWAVGIDFKLQENITFARGLTPLILVESLKGAPANLDRKGVLAGEFLDLFGRAFAGYSRLTVGMRARGGGGSLVLNITAIDEDSAYTSIIAKCGWLGNVTRERDHYSNHVQPYILSHAARLFDNRVYETRNFGLIKYIIAGTENVWQTRTFSDYFSQQSDTRDGSPLLNTVKYVISDVTNAWHKHEAPRRKGEFLNRFYEQRLLRGKAGPADQSSDSMWDNVGAAVQRVAAQARQTNLLDNVQVPTMLRWSIDGQKYETFEPHQFLSPFRDRDSALFQSVYETCRGHGDLHGDNILIDEVTDVKWLIDFEQTDWGPILQDAVELESSIHFSLLDENDIVRRLRLEAALGSRAAFSLSESPPIDLSADRDKALSKAYAVIRALRDAAKGILGAREEDYLLGLIYHSLRVIVDDHPQRDSDMRPPWFFQVQALCLASFCCYQLSKLTSARQS